ncbi:hypothetical protein JCM8202_000182 [Rhodotorula sphaerocarpa]
MKPLDKPSLVLLFALLLGVARVGRALPVAQQSPSNGGAPFSSAQHRAPSSAPGGDIRAVGNPKDARTSDATSTSRRSTNTAATTTPVSVIANPKDQHGHWPSGIKIVPVWTINGTTIWGVKPTHPGRPKDWPPTSLLTSTPS